MSVSEISISNDQIKATKAVTLKSKPDGITVTEKGLEIKRLFTKPGDQFATVDWELRTAEIKDHNGKVIFKQENVEFPKTWSQTATNVVVNKYFRGLLGSPTRENSVKQLIGRVVNTITKHGTELGYFSSTEDAVIFCDELTHILLTQKAAFNSPVWFNVGVEEHPQSSACFINSVEDTMGSILDLAKTEGMLFKYGSGAGSNLSSLRSSFEKLRGGGDASGPVSFMKGFDAFAGVIKSGGKCRRAAKIVILNVDHPDIMEFINCKASEEKKAWALIDAGYDGAFNIKGGAYDSVSFQNANHSIRVTDAFMKAVENDAEWKTQAVSDKTAAVPTYKAREIWKAIGEAAHLCGDPGIQFDTMINDWHTLANSGPINASNPCFSGDQKIFYTKEDGSRATGTLRELAGRNIIVPTVGSDGSINLRPASVLLTKKNTELVKVTLDDDSVIKVTPDHLFMLRNRTYRRVDELVCDDSLMPFNLKKEKYWNFYLPRYGRGKYSMLLMEYKLGGRTWNSNEVHVHHKDEDKYNDIFDNLELKDAHEHMSEHLSGENNPMRGRWWGPLSETEREDYLEKRSEISAGSGNGMYGKNQSESARSKMSAASHEWRKNKAVKSAYAALELGKSIETPEEWDKVRRDVLLPLGLYAVMDIPKSNALARLFDSYDEFLKVVQSTFNHRIKKVEPCDNEDVYDVQVHSNEHNFALVTSESENHYSGIFVHNCSEYMSIDDSACNLSSLNLMKFRRADGEFDVDSFRHAVSTMILAQDILVDASSYPTPKIGENTRAYRQLGLGYANLGALLMVRGLAYDSDEARAYSAGITSLMCGHAYLASSLIAKSKEPFSGYKKNEEPMLRVIEKHLNAATALTKSQLPVDLATAAKDAWIDALNYGRIHGFRNSQVTVLAPTGTIAFLMDCDTTGIEPDIALVKYKKLVGGGYIKIVNNTVPEALARLGYDELGRKIIIDHIEKTDTIENCKTLKEEHLRIFDCAFKAANGSRSIEPKGHIEMMAAVQPFLSGAISKTVNVPTIATAEDMQEMYMLSWKKGLKAVALYRDGSKRSQPLTTSEKEKKATKHEPVRRHLPDERVAMTHKFQISGHEGYLTVGFYEDGTLGEIFVTMAKEGSTVSGLIDQWAQCFSLLLQHGVKLDKLVEKFSYARFEPSGWTGHPQIGHAKSITDYIVRYLGFKYLPKSEIPSPIEEAVKSVSVVIAKGTQTFQNQSDSPACATCGDITVRNGSCYKCNTCGSTSGCS